MQEFIRNGFEKASTNEIVKVAEISKGSLFNYFNNKKDLYLFLFDCGIEISDEIFEEMDWTDTDIFHRWREGTVIKFEKMKKYPELFNFLKAVMEEESTEVKSDIGNKVKHFSGKSFEKMYANIDLTKFRDDIDVEKTINIMQWTLEGFSERERLKQKALSIEEVNWEEMIKELDQYLDLMKRCFYK